MERLAKSFAVAIGATVGIFAFAVAMTILMEHQPLVAFGIVAALVFGAIFFGIFTGSRS